MRNKFIVVFVVLLALIVLFLNNESNDKVALNDKPVMEIGVIAPLSGNNAALGENCKRGIELALDDLKNTELAYHVIFEDDGFQASRAASAANKLINVDKVDVLMTCSAVSGAGAVPIADRNGKFIITVIASEENIAKQSKYSFLHWPSPWLEAEKLMEIFKKNDVKKAVFMIENHAGAKALGNVALEIANKKGIEVIEYNFMSTERHFTDIVMKADADKADIWVLLTLQPGINIIGKRMRELAIKTPYTTEEIPTFMEDKSMFEGVEFVDVYDGRSDILNRYQKKYNTSNVYGAAFAYDAIMIANHLAETFYAQNKKLPNSDELAYKLQNLHNYNGAVGSIVIDEDGILQSRAVIKKVKNGKVVTVKE